MKKVLIALTLMATILIAGFTSSQHTMLIKPSKFSEQTKKALGLSNDEVQFFDITLDDTVKSHTLSVWVYSNGEWVGDRKTLGDNFAFRQIAIGLNDSSYDIYDFHKEGYVKASCPILGTDFENCTVIQSAKIDEPTTIELNKETPIWVKIGTDKNSMRTIDITQDFRTYECKTGVAITFTASDEIVE